MPPDYLAGNFPASFLGRAGKPVSGSDFVLESFVLTPYHRPVEDWDRRATPGLLVRVALTWSTVSRGDPNAVVWFSIFGDWQPERPLGSGRVWHGPSGDRNGAMVSFVAPATPGRYRVRWILAEGRSPVRSFYGTPNHGPNDPGGGAWSELGFEVVGGR